MFQYAAEQAAGLRQLCGDRVHLVGVDPAARIDPVGNLIHIVGGVPQGLGALVQLLDLQLDKGKQVVTAGLYNKLLVLSAKLLPVSIINPIAQWMIKM